MIRAMAMRRAGRGMALAALALVGLGNTGCLDFEKQTVVMVFPKGTKEIRGLLVYENVRVSGAKDADLAKAKDELKELMTANRIFYFGSPLAKVELEDRKDDKDEVRESKALWRKHLVLRPGGLFLNAKGQLCAYQTWTIRDREKFAAEQNALVSKNVAKSAAEQLGKVLGQDAWGDKETLRLWEGAGKNGFAWLRLEPGRVSVTVPATPTATRRFKHQLFKDGEGFGEWLRDNPWSFDQRTDRFTVSLGLGDGEPIRVATLGDRPDRARLPDPNLIAYARTLRGNFQEGRTVDGVIAEFLRNKGR